MAKEGETNDMIVRAAVCHHFTQAISAMEPGEAVTPYMVNLAKAIVG